MLCMLGLGKVVVEEEESAVSGRVKRVGMMEAACF